MTKPINISGTYRNRHRHSLLVEALGPVEMRTGATRKLTGVLYRRMDKDEGLTVRGLEEFKAKFEEVKE